MVRLSFRELVQADLTPHGNFHVGENAEIPSTPQPQTIEPYSPPSHAHLLLSPTALPHYFHHAAY